MWGDPGKWLDRVAAFHGSHPHRGKIAILPENLRRPDATWKVRLIEEEFMRLMFDMLDA